ncbi:hypothetical protein ACQYRI_10210 [Salmonella enterica]
MLLARFTAVQLVHAKHISSPLRPGHGPYQDAPVKAVPIAAKAASKPEKVAESEQHAQAAKKKNNFAETCGPEDYILSNGVYLWTETTAQGMFLFRYMITTTSIYTPMVATEEQTGALFRRWDFRFL